HQYLSRRAPRLELLVVDEAHHARRQGGDVDEYRPARLLQLLDRVKTSDHARSIWLLTATPMQVHAVELLDLLRHVGLQGRLEDFDEFQHFHNELAKADDQLTDWTVLARWLREAPAPFDAADRALLDRIRTK